MPNFAHIVELAYRAILGREADPGGLAHWNERMQAGLTEASLRDMFARGTEFATRFPGGAGAPPPVDPPPPPPPPPPALTFPIRAGFYYAWYPETWNVNGKPVFYHPTLGHYESANPAVVDAHVRALDYGKFNVAIASWWGQRHQSEEGRIPLLLERTRALGSPLKWALYYEREGSGDPGVPKIREDLAYIRSRYASRPEYAHIGGKPVLFVYNADDADCSVAREWREAAGTDWYLVMKAFAGFTTCSEQPDAWHQYGPSAGEHNSGSSYVISPGYWQADEASPRLPRDPIAWRERVRRMVASGKPLQLVTTINEWGEGTSVESADEWASPSEFGVYLDALHNDGA